MTLRTIHVGVGGRGRWPVRVMGADRRYEPVALVDTDPRALTAAAEALSDDPPPSFGTLTQALDAVDAHAVVVVTPTHTHAAFVREAFEHGKHVLVEKGMADSWSEATALVAMADQANVCFAVAQNYRYLPDVIAIDTLLRDRDDPRHPGAIGIADLSFHRYRPEPRNFVYPYAMVWDMACHHADLLVMWLGPARQAVAVAYNPAWSVYDHPANLVGVIEMESGATCHYSIVHNATIGEWRILLQGDRGALRAGGSGDFFPRRFPASLEAYPAPDAQLGAAEPVMCELPAACSSEEAVADAFFRYVTDGVEPDISGRRNLETLAICEMLIRSSEEHRPVPRKELDDP